MFSFSGWRSVASFRAPSSVDQSTARPPSPSSPEQSSCPAVVTLGASFVFLIAFRNQTPTVNPFPNPDPNPRSFPLTPLTFAAALFSLESLIELLNLIYVVALHVEYAAFLFLRFW